MDKPTYRTEIKPMWCPGCGDYGVLKALTAAMQRLEIPNHMITVVSGIGCSSRIVGYVDTYGVNLLHGRAVPTAEGVKMARPELTVFTIGGDGDLFSIGGGHMAHAVRRNIDLTCICMNNLVYGMTKGQPSPTTPLEVAVNEINASPLDPVFNMLGYSIRTRQSFIAQSISTDVKHLTDLIVRGVLHKGFSFINVLSECVQYRKEAFEAMKGRCVHIGEDHDRTDINAALRLAETPITATPHLGVFFEGNGA